MTYNSDTTNQGQAAEDARKAGDLLQLEIAGVRVNFRWAPAGTFVMGSLKREWGHWSGEIQHEVKLTQGFWICETQTPQELWVAVTRNNPSRFKDSNQLPVEHVSWYDCLAFIEVLNRIHASALPVGYHYTLPTEAQWEYACRAGTTTPFNFGDSSYGDKANYDGRFPYRTSTKSKYKARTTPVKRFAPNAWGLYDMHGNVWEWCENCVIEYDTSSEEQMVLIKQERSSDLVQRGGSWRYAPEFCRSAYRRLVAPTDEDSDFGFRLVLAPGTRYQHIDAETEAVRQYQQIVQESENRVYPSGDEPEATREPGAITTLEIAGIPVNFHWAPAGTFLMGSPESEAWRRQEEMQHEVTLTKGFWIAETLTTWELWKAVWGESSDTEWSNSFPRWELNWNDCQDFVDKLNTDFSNALPSGYKYAMPTEAQWEYACRAGTTTPFNFGSVLVGDCQAHFAYNYPIMDIEVYNIGAVPVKSFAPNAWGLYEMHGNLCEWTSDWYDRDYYASSSVKVDPTGSESGDRRVLRGGCFVREWWLSRLYNPRSAARQNDVPDSRVFSFYFGFRLVLVR